MAKKRRRPNKRARARDRALVWGDLLGRVRLWMLALFLLSMPLFFLPGNTEYGYTKTVYTLVFISALMLLWALEGLLRREWEVELSWLFPVVPAFLLVSFLSLTGGAALGLVLQSAAIILYFGFIYLLVVNTAREDRDVVVLLGALLAAGVGTGLYGLLQYTGTVAGGPGRGLGAIISSMGNRQFLAGFLSYLVLPAGILLVRLRRPWSRAMVLVGAGFVLAVMLLTRQVGVRVGLAVAAGFVAFALGLWPAKGAKWTWWCAAGAAVLLALGLVGGWVWLLSGAALLGVCGAVWGGARVVRRCRWAWIPTAAVAVLVLILLIPTTTPINYVRELWGGKGPVRSYDWWVGYEMWRDSPAFGIGVSAYKVDFVPYKAVLLETPRGQAYDFPIAPAAQAHNEYVQVAAEMGTAGFLVLLGGLGGIVWLGLRRIAAQHDPERRLELVLLGGGVLVTLVHATVTFPWRLPASSLAFVALLGMAFSPRYGALGGWRIALRGKALAVAVTVLGLLGASVSVIAVRDLIADRYLFQGRGLLNAGYVERAQEALDRSVSLDFFPRLSLYWLGMAHLQAGELEAARDTLQNCFGRYVNDPLYVNLAQVHMQLDEHDKARELLQELLATGPRQEAEQHGRYLLAVIEGQQGRHAEAAELLQRVVEQDPGHWRAWLFLGEMVQAQQQLGDARQHYERALEIIEREMARLEERLGERVLADEAARLEREYQELQRARETVERYLAQLP
ncbi:MAG: tetratricopeptide repeat protein [Candidatus Bipolaricaulota bacterium]